MYRFLAKFYPEKIREGYGSLLRYSGIKVNADKFVGFIGAFGVLLSLVVAFSLGYFFEIPVLIVFFGFLFVFEILVYFILLLRADTKAKFVESILPDVLQLMASNLRAGLTTDKALLLSARPEFGPFQGEINQVGKEVTMGKNIATALSDMVKHIRSERLSKTVELIVAGLVSGGELAALLEHTAKNLRRERLVDSRIRANVMMYVIFIFIAVCVGAPMLFGLSSFLVEVLTENIGAIDIPESTSMSMPMSFTAVSISVNFVIMFAVTFLITSSVMGSFILGLISKGKEREGLRFMPILIAISLGMFFLVRFAIKSMLGGLFNF